jgi:hypothetical protein
MAAKVDIPKVAAKKARVRPPGARKRAAAKQVSTPEPKADAAEPLVLDLREVDRPRDLQAEQVELLKQLLERVTAIEERLNENGARTRRLRLLKR